MAFRLRHPCPAPQKGSRGATALDSGPPTTTTTNTHPSGIYAHYCDSPTPFSRPLPSFGDGVFVAIGEGVPRAIDRRAYSRTSGKSAGKLKGNRPRARIHRAFGGGSVVGRSAIRAPMADRGGIAAIWFIFAAGRPKGGDSLRNPAAITRRSWRLIQIWREMLTFLGVCDSVRAISPTQCSRRGAVSRVVERVPVSHMGGAIWGWPRRALTLQGHS